MAGPVSNYGATATEQNQQERKGSDESQSSGLNTYQTNTVGPGSSATPRESHFAQRAVQFVVLGGLVLALFVAYSMTIPGPAVLPTKMGVVEGSAKKDQEVFYHHQLVNHKFEVDAPSNYYSQRYYEKADYFAGPGHPIMVIVGGEDDLWGILYPFVSERLAKRFSAYTLCVEHRFYGKSWPVPNPSNADLKTLLSPDQAMRDLVRLVRYKQDELGCSHDRDSLFYCPVVTVGGSYPGFLSAALRLLHSDTVDIAYASSAPLYLYSQSVDQGAYYEKVSEVAEQASQGCRIAVKHNLVQVKEDLSALQSDDHELFSQWLSRLGICADSIPRYIEKDPQKFSDELFMVVDSFFADMNMDYYPPSDQTALVRACTLFQGDDGTPTEKVGQLLKLKMVEEGSDEDSESSCFDLMAELPGGPRATISGSDWSGMGGGEVAWIWDFQSCILMPDCGFSDESMFPTRNWSLDWMTEHCERRFGITPKIGGLVEELFGSGFTSFDNLLLRGGGAVPEPSHILFTNGMKDGWSIASVLRNLTDTIQARNLPNGAHHSDLSHQGPTAADTEDIQQAFVEIANLLEKWLNDITNQR
jgi:hypothetical protein